jgi:hypothetical protein
VIARWRDDVADSFINWNGTFVTAATMAESFPKRQKIEEMESGESRRLAVGKAIESILNIDIEEFQSHVGNMEFAGYTKLTERLSKIGQAMKDSRPIFSDIPASAVAPTFFIIWKTGRIGIILLSPPKK